MPEHVGCQHCGCRLLELDEEDLRIICPRCNRERSDLMAKLKRKRGGLRAFFRWALNHA